MYLLFFLNLLRNLLCFRISYYLRIRSTGFLHFLQTDLRRPRVASLLEISELPLLSTWKHLSELKVILETEEVRDKLFNKEEAFHP